MGFQAVPDTAEITLIFSQNAEILANVFHAELVGGYTLADIGALANVVDGLIPATLIPIMSLDCEYVRTEVRGLANENDFLDVDGTNSGFGTDGSPGLPNQVTLSIKKISGLTGRSARGRWYFVGMPENKLGANENSWTIAGADNAALAVEAVRLGVAATAWDAVIVSRFAGGVERAVGVTFPWIGVVLVNRFVDTQRRRLTR